MLTPVCQYRQQAQELIAARDKNAARERLLYSWCSGFSLIRGLSATGVSADDGSGHELELLLQQALANLPQVPYARSRELLPASFGLHYGTIAPAADPVAHLRRLLSWPLLPSAATMTSQQLGQILRSVTLEAAIQHHRMSVCPAEQHGAIVEKMQSIWDRYFHAVVSLFLLGRMDVSEALAVFNLETQEFDPQGAVQYEGVLEARIDQLQLSPQQHEALAIGGCMSEERMRSVLVSCQRLQRKNLEACSRSSTSSQQQQQQQYLFNEDGLQVNPCQDSGSLDAADGGRISSSTSSASSSSNTLNTLRVRQLCMEATHQHVTRLGFLLGEESLIRVVTGAWLVGCLSWPQLTLLGIICWPYTYRPAVLVRAIKVQWRERLQQQQQEGSQQQQQQQQQQQGSQQQQQIGSQ